MPNPDGPVNVMETSHPFTVKRGTIFLSLLMSPSIGWPLWCVSLIGLFLIAVGCLCDIRYLILGLIVCLTVFPTMAFFIFVRHMFSTEMVANLLHHSVERRPSGYLVRIYRPAEPGEPIEAGKEWIENGRLTLFNSNVVKTKTTSEYEIIFFKDSPLEILYIPLK